MTQNVVALVGRKQRPAWDWSDRIRKVRKDLRMTQAQFAAMTGLGEKRIAAWESGRNPRPHDIEAVAVLLEEVTGVDRLWWIGWADAEPTPPSGVTGNLPDTPAINTDYSPHLRTLICDAA